jgi:3-phosphoshikimate 1-carboxyvinyltransferase
VIKESSIMNKTLTRKTTPFLGAITIPGDKSISHRAVMFGAIAKGTTEITNFLQGADCLSTIDCFCKMGICIENTPEKIKRFQGEINTFEQRWGEILDSGDPYYNVNLSLDTEVYHMKNIKVNYGEEKIIKRKIK